MNSDLELDWEIRLAAFSRLAELTRRHGPVLSWGQIEQGFEFRGRRMRFANMPKGIFKPEGMPNLSALSIKTVVPKPGKEARYDDVASDEYFEYRFQGSDPNAHDNWWLRTAHELGLPLIYLYGVAPSVYQPLWPAYIVGFHPKRLTCQVGVGDTAEKILQPGTFAADPIAQQVQRNYCTVQAKRRIHQQMFRAQVLSAYQHRCTVCRLPREELLEAAHIIPDRDERGRPEVPNGLSLCRLHHGAYDTNLLGIRPDGVIELSPVLMDTHDGPTLEYGLKGFAGRRIHQPRPVRLRPRQEYLEERFEIFRASQ